MDRTRWYECYGGPDDGQMGELCWEIEPDASLQEGGIVLYGPETRTDLDGVVRPINPLGVYKPSGWTDQALGIARLVWDPNTDWFKAA